MKKSFPSSVKLVFKGIGMGLAEVIPGVSGGTIAFITGIYEQLMLSIKSFDTDMLNVYKQDGFSGLWYKVNGNFLLTLFLGMAIGLAIGAFAISFLIEHYPKQIWALFFGLIAASFFYVLSDTNKIGWIQILLIVVGTIVAYLITVLSPADTNTSLLFVGISGMIAISALLLPGISGSFILLLLGLYTYILTTFKSVLQTFDLKDLTVLLVFGVGCVIGAAFFSRVITWTFKRYRDSTLCLLAGFLLGSLNKIWPWRIPVLWRNQEGEIISSGPSNLHERGLKVISEQNLLPSNYPHDPEIVSVLLCMALGIGLVWILSRYKTPDNPVSNP